MLSFGQKIRWTLRLLLFRKVRIHIHLPVEANTRSGRWVRFDSKLHDQTVAEIENYLAERFQGLSFDVWVKRNTGGIWAGVSEENIIVFIDLRARLQDIEWFFKMEKEVWRERFDQQLIYVAIHPLWN